MGVEVRAEVVRRARALRRREADIVVAATLGAVLRGSIDFPLERLEGSPATWRKEASRDRVSLEVIMRREMMFREALHLDVLTNQDKIIQATPRKHQRHLQGTKPTETSDKLPILSRLLL